MAVNKKDLHAFDVQRTRAARFSDILGEMSIAELLVDVEGGVRLEYFKVENPTIGDFLEKTAAEIARTPYMGRVGMTGLYAALGRLTSHVVEKHGLQHRLEEPRAVNARLIDEDRVGDEIRRLVAIERRLAVTPLPDGTERTSQDIAQAAIAIYSALPHEASDT